jgi:hypothetical protein
MGNMPAKITGKYRSYDINGVLPSNSSYAQTSTLKVHRRPAELMADEMIERKYHVATDAKRNPGHMNYYEQPLIDSKASQKSSQRREPYQIETDIDEMDNETDEIKEHNIDQIKRLEESIYNTNTEHLKQFSSSSYRSSQIIEASNDTSPYSSRIISHLNDTNQHRHFNHDDDEGKVKILRKLAFCLEYHVKTILLLKELEDEHLNRGINYRKVDVIY